MNLNKTKLVLIVLCIVSVVLAKVATPTKKLSDISPIVLEDIIPKEFDSWRIDPIVHDVIQSPEQDAIIKKTYSQILTRTYIDNFGNQVMLSIAYTDDQTDNAGKQSHKPEICYPAQGFTIKAAESFNLKTRFGLVNARKLLATTADRVEPIIYWTMIGNIVANDDLAIKKAQITNGLSGVLPDGIIFRVSMINKKDPIEYSILTRYIDNLLSALSKSDRKRIAGFN